MLPSEGSTCYLDKWLKACSCLMSPLLLRGPQTLQYTSQKGRKNETRNLTIKCSGLLTIFFYFSHKLLQIRGTVTEKVVLSYLHSTLSSLVQWEMCEFYFSNVKCQMLYAFLTDTAINSNKYFLMKCLRYQFRFLLKWDFEIYKNCWYHYLGVWKILLNVLYLRRVEALMLPLPCGKVSSCHPIP